MVGGYPFRILFYPQGKNAVVHSRGQVSLFIRHESPNAVESVYALHILEQIQLYPPPPIHAGFSYEDRRGFRQVLTLKPRYLEGNFHFKERDFIEEPNNFYLVGDCIKIRAIIGVFIDLPFGKLCQPFDRYIFFQLESGTRYFTEESVLVSRCPHLLPNRLLYRYDRDILISDIKDDVFEAVLWFIYNDKLDEYDREAIYKSKPSDLDSFYLRMLAAADRLNMKHLRRQCESILSSNIEEHGLCYTIKSSFEKLWSGAHSLLDSSKKIKNA